MIDETYRPFFVFASFSRLQQLEAEDDRTERKESKDPIINEKEIDAAEKHALPDSALFQPIQDKPREKVEPTKEMRAAIKVLNDNLKKSPSKNVSHQTKNAANVIQQEWFKISSTATANPLDVEDYLDCFEEFSSYLLEYIVNMTDSSGNTAMHYAVSHGNFDVVSILLDSKVCDINRANVAGYTAVMLAALADLRNSTHASVANRLFQLADVNIRAKLVIFSFPSSIPCCSFRIPSFSIYASKGERVCTFEKHLLFTRARDKLIFLLILQFSSRE